MCGCWKLQTPAPAAQGETFTLCIWLHGKNVSEAATFFLSFIFASLSLSLHFYFPAAPPPSVIARPSSPPPPPPPSSVRPCDRPTTCPTRKIAPLARDPRRCATRSLGWSPGIITQVLILHCPFLSREWRLEVETVTVSFDFFAGRCVRLIWRIT